MGAKTNRFIKCFEKKIALIEETQLGVAWPMECRVFKILLVFWLVEEKEAAIGTFGHELVLTRQISYKADTRERH